MSTGNRGRTCANLLVQYETFTLAPFPVYVVMGYGQFSDKDFATVMEDEESPPKKQ
ncbi:hypothetical protein PI124_g22426 [Phytophthora idaei]|nr:hypothetical protein PI125_g24143 [Phytophthora idaei]KAG3126734.1 hypothetical protein PI126_g22199 [Phytophthora idaei]KAG3232493.1 hypothetical protein PI124_g22426 [Phytophthora idaei]